MLQVLRAEFGKVGLELNCSKTKVLTMAKVVIVNDAPIDVMNSSGSHKYLGKIHSSELTKRGHIGFQHGLG